MRSLAVIPPMLLDDYQKKLQFYNNNGLLDDPKTINEETVSKTNYWTDTEKEIFRDKYLHRPKNFGYIASALHNKVCCFLFHNARMYWVLMVVEYDGDEPTEVNNLLSQP